jgi:hypothetical protein
MCGRRGCHWTAIAVALLAIVSNCQSTFGQALGHDAAIGPVQLDGWYCATGQSCNGLRMLGSSGTGLAGCGYTGTGTECTGKCTYCTGTGTAKTCARGSSSDSCTSGGGGGSSVDCGGTAKNSCTYSADSGLDIPCWCANTGGTPEATSGCSVKGCS